MTAALWIAGALLAVYLLVSLTLFMLIFRRGPDPLKSTSVKLEKLLEPYHELMDAGRSWQENHPYETAEITSFDELKLRARLYLHPEARAVLVACHGYRSSGVRDFASAIRYYNEHRMSVLLIDQRACGESGGACITFGIKERHDARSWCEYAASRFPGLPIGLAGISMGAAAVLMTADDLPDAVSAILADCGYTSAWEELSYAAKHYYTPAAALFLPGVELFCRLLGGFSLKERTAPEALANSSLPVFFAHGEADELVPPENTLKNRAACAGPTELLLVPGADHGMSYLVDHAGYCRALDDFLETYVLTGQRPDDRE